MKSLFKLTDAELSVQLAEMQTEARRRTQEATSAAGRPECTSRARGGITRASVNINLKERAESIW